MSGFSQGGGLSLAAAALAPGLVRLCMADMPYLCDIERGAQIAPEAPYTELTRYLALHPERHDEIVGTLRHVDCALLAPRIRARCIVSVGLMDPICPPSTVYAAYNAITAPEGAVRVPVRHARAAVDAPRALPRGVRRRVRLTRDDRWEPGRAGAVRGLPTWRKPVSRSSRTPHLSRSSALVAALALALALSLRGGSGSGTAFAAATAAPADALANAQRTLTFTGSGDVELQPDTAHVERLGARRAATSSDAALAVATGKMKAVIAALASRSTRVRIGDADLVTQGVDTSRDWEHEGRYLSDQSLGITLHDPARAGAVIAAATAAGADSVDGPSFSLDEQTRRLSRRAAGALADARSKADARRGRWASRSSARAPIAENAGRRRARSCTRADASAKSAGAAPPVKLGTGDGRPRR